jgi:hypothetical protein
MKLKISKKVVTLEDLPQGSLFITTDNTCLGLKTEYCTEQGAIEAYIIGSGEVFWGGTNVPKDQRKVLVHEVKTKIKSK